MSLSVGIKAVTRWPQGESAASLEGSTGTPIRHGQPRESIDDERLGLHRD